MTKKDQFFIKYIIILFKVYYINVVHVLFLRIKIFFQTNLYKNTRCLNKVINLINLYKNIIYIKNFPIIIIQKK